MEEKKSRVTVYLTTEAENMLDELIIKGIREKNKLDKSATICKAIELLYEKRFK